MEMNSIHTKNPPSPTGITIEQGDQGYRYSMEPFLLANFIRLRPGQEVLDIGTGCGIIPILLAHLEPGVRIRAVEIQRALYNQAVQNIMNNQLTDRVMVVHGDVLDSLDSLRPGTFDAILSNPPFKEAQTGRTNPDPEKAIARHELSLDLSSLVKKSASLLKPGGRIHLAYPPERLLACLETLRLNKLHPSRLRFVHPYTKSEACIFLVEAVLGRQEEFTVETPFIIFQNDRSYSKEMAEIYASINHTGRPDHVSEK